MRIIKEHVPSYGKDLYHLYDAAGTKKLAQNKHDVLLATKSIKCKNCINLSIKPHLQTMFYPACIEGSLIWEPDSENNETLAGCPSDCSYYIPVWRHKVSRILVNCKNNIIAPFRWFDRQDRYIKLVILLIVFGTIIRSFFPQLTPLFIEIIQALHCGVIT